MLYDGDEIVDRDTTEHAAAEAVMKRLESFETSDPEFTMLLDQLLKDTRRHVDAEENEPLPRLRVAGDPQRLRDLRKLHRAKQTAPTWPCQTPNTRARCSRRGWA